MNDDRNLYISDGGKRILCNTKFILSFLCILGNNQIQCWLRNAVSGDTIIGGTTGTALNQLKFSETILFDKNYNLLVVGRFNYRIQLFNLTVC